MDRQRWQRITESFDAALECPAGERAAYLARSCAGDDELLVEVSRLLEEFEKAGDFLEKPLATQAQAVSVGDLIVGRYRIEILLGRGGMGEVFRAHDEFMDERIALKTLRPELCDNPGFVRRFQREVQLARKVTHANVCRVFEVGIHTARGGPVYFFTMQLLEGQTLAAHIRRHGRFPRREAVPLIVQMANGLQAAHEAGIIHRDFKSSNVILCGDKAVITDFGLARVEPGLAPLQPAGIITTNAQVAGTVAFMSPEQLAGAEVTAASDIYSFGIVLFEMATGRLPFDDRNIIQSAMQRASDSTLNVRAIAPDIDPEWAVVITRCLQRDPAKRFRGAAEVAQRLRLDLWRFPTPHWTRRQWATAAGVAAVSAAALSLIPFASRFYKQDAELREGADALLSPIANSTGDARFDGIAELFRNQLSQSVHLNLLDGTKLGSALKQMGKAENTTDASAVREAAWRLNAACSIFGNVSRIGPDYALNIQIETRGPQPDSPRTKSLRSFSAGDPAALMRTVRDASVWVRETVGESAANIANFDRLPADATTPSWEALSYFARGQNFFMKQDFEPAILEFEAALRVDPVFTLAAVRRADLLVSQHRQREGFAQWRQAMELLKQRPVTRPEELNARGMFAMDIGDFEASDRYFRTWSAEYPHEWKAPFYRMMPLVMTGNAAEAAGILNAVRQKVPDYGELYAELIHVYLILGRTDEARRLLPELRKRNRPERATLREGFIRFREGDCVGCFGIYRELQKSDWRRGAADGMLYEALLLIDAGLPAAAADNTARFLGSGSWVEIAAQQINLLLVQAWAEMLTGRRAQSLKHARQVLEGEDGPLIVSYAATIFARLGARGEAEAALKICGNFLDFPLYKIAWRRIRAELDAANGDRSSALREFRAAAAIEPRIAHRQYLIEALPAADPERLELCRNVVRIPWQSAFRPPPLYSLGALSLAVPAVNDAGLDEPFARRFAASAKQLAQIA